ncbi:succinylglutamate desuccinylase/aspartoacylase family protein [Burkholderia guangdongensis]|uniref:succinylglutamate desuccinylase/aspartoacylase family protein n=1 Tax=Burkholderia guangdongensis TaxID=1792500 RepID=UPI0015CD467E|nr:succinylglutamate desuccinylase/aspartoacylase family protein [Burkholderia guangdongensis]
MNLHNHVIEGLPPGTQRQVTSLSFGTRTAGGPKAYIQAGLHASEIPGLLVAHYLRDALRDLEHGGHLLGEVVLVPVCNPIGLDQTLLSYAVGRFDLASGENFNRSFPMLAETVAAALADTLTDDAAANVRAARAALVQCIAKLNAKRPVHALRKILLGLACDADLVIDLHCDCESVLHVFTQPDTVADVMPLSALLGAHATIHAEAQPTHAFDEVAYGFWSALQKHFPAHPLPSPVVSTTVELRGQLDVNHDQAKADARAIVDYLRLRGFVDGAERVRVPDLTHEATALDATEVIHADRPGVIVYLAEVGQRLAAGEPVVDVVDAVNGEVKRHCASTAGVLFARQNRRFAWPGMDLAYIAGSVPIRTGNLWSL